MWGGSEFIRDSIKRVTDKPVFAPPPYAPRPEVADLGPVHFGLDPARMYLVTMFDAHSIHERKNPTGAIEAFKRAFAPNEGPHLIVKAINVDRYVPGVQDHGRPDVAVINRYMPVPEKNALLNLSRTLVSLHRSEGFGLPLLEAMWLERGTIATNYSGNLDFMNQETSWLMPYRRVPIVESSGFYPRDQEWAEPDIDAAAVAIRESVLDQSLYDIKVSAAKKLVSTLHERRIDFVRQRLSEIT